MCPAGYHSPRIRVQDYIVICRGGPNKKRIQRKRSDAGSPVEGERMRCGVTKCGNGGGLRKVESSPRIDGLQKLRLEDPFVRIHRELQQVNAGTSRG